jgi:hypothetical protein
MGKGPWFRQRAKEVREGAREKNVDRSLTLAGIAVGIMASLVIPRSPVSVFAGSLVSFGLLLYPVWHARWIERKLERRIIGILFLALIVFVFGYLSWPKPAQQMMKITLRQMIMDSAVMPTAVHIHLENPSNEVYAEATDIVYLMNRSKYSRNGPSQTQLEEELWNKDVKWHMEANSCSSNDERYDTCRHIR